MRVVIQRVTSARVTVDGLERAGIGLGFLVLAGIETDDTVEDADWLAGKVAGLRVFADDGGMMNRSVAEVGGAILVVSQFTLHASYKKGNRPSFLRAARPEAAIPIYEAFAEMVGQKSGVAVQTGVFGADMKVELLNDGPVTIFMDSRNRE
jgi:D-aminoacyl-tRNA deacylase